MSNFIANAARSAYDIAFQVSPIILTGGIVANTNGSALPIIALTGQVASFAQGALTGGLSLDDFYARFLPLPGSTVISNAIGMYPFANQDVAANAIIRQPLNISLQMIAPVKDAGGYFTKLAIFTALQQSLQSHNAAGGTYSIATPSYIYTACIMTGMTDITSGETKQQQVAWQLDFVQPLVTQQQAQSSYSGLMSKLAGGQQAGSSWSGLSGVPSQGALSGVSQQAANVTNFLAQPI
jgi:hypothetical protein